MIMVFRCTIQKVLCLGRPAESPKRGGGGPRAEEGNNHAGRMSGFYPLCETSAPIPDPPARYATRGRYRRFHAPLYIPRVILHTRRAGAGGHETDPAARGAARWKCSSTCEKNWETTGFDDSAWLPAADGSSVGIITHTTHSETRIVRVAGYDADGPVRRRERLAPVVEARGRGDGALDLELGDGPGPPGRLNILRVSPSKSVFDGAFVSARRALNSQKRRFLARAGDARHGG